MAIITFLKEEEKTNRGKQCQHLPLLHIWQWNIM